MNEIKIFNSPQFGEIRTAITEAGDPLFCASDITNALGYSNGRKAISDNCNPKGVTTSDTLTNGGIQSLAYINEGNLYRLVMKSKKPEAEKFEAWVCEEVLPAIRKTGGYIATLSEDTPEIILARAILVANDAIERLKNKLDTREQQIALQAEELKKQAPKAEYYDSVLDSEGLIAITLIAKDLGMSAATLNRKLSAMNIIYRCQDTWVVSAKYQALGYAKSKSFPFHDSKGQLHTQIHFYWTQRGREFLFSKLQKSA